MKKLYCFLLFLLFTLTNSNRLLAQTYYPTYLISNMNTKFTTLANTVDRNKIDQIGALGIPKHAVEKFIAAKFAKSATATSFTLELFPTQASAIEGLGVIEIVNNTARIAYAEAHTTASLIEQQERWKRTHCRKFLFFKKHCTESFFYKPRGFTIFELNSIKSAIKNKSTSELEERILSIQNLSRYYPK